jgi:hypothetical protein
MENFRKPISRPQFCPHRRWQSWLSIERELNREHSVSILQFSKNKQSAFFLKTTVLSRRKHFADQYHELRTIIKLPLNLRTLTEAEHDEAWKRKLKVRIEDKNSAQTKTYLMFKKKKWWHGSHVPENNLPCTVIFFWKKCSLYRKVSSLYFHSSLVSLDSKMSNVSCSAFRLSCLMEN